MPDQQKTAIPDTRHEHGIYHSFEEMARLKGAWDDLAARVGDLYCSYDWCETWWQHFGAARRLEIHTLHAGDALVAVLPLFRETLRLGLVRLRVVRLLGSDYTVDGAGLAIEPACAEPFLQAVLTSLSDRGAWDLLQFGPLHSYVQAAEQLADAAARSPFVQTAVLGRQDNWLTLFDLPDSYEGYLRGLSRDERHSTERRLRQLETAHAVEITAAHSPQDVPAGMDALVQLHQQHWTGKGERGIFGDWPAVEQFHRRLADRLVQTGRLVLLTLRAGEQTVGAAYGYHFGSRTHSMIRGYDNSEPWRRFGLGRLLHCQVVQQAIGRGSTVIDDGRGVFEYKLRLGGTLHGERSLTLVRRGWVNRLRVWMCLRLVYLVHVVYSRILLDRVAPRLGIHRAPSEGYIRWSFLAQLFRRTRFRLFGGPRIELARPVDPVSPPDDARRPPASEPSDRTTPSSQDKRKDGVTGVRN